MRAAALTHLTLFNLLFLLIRAFVFDADMCRSLMEDLESSEEQMSKGWKELENKREIILLKEVCA